MLKSYAYNMRNMARDPKLSGKIELADKEMIERGVNYMVEWQDRNQLGRRWSSSTSRRIWRSSAIPSSRGCIKAGAVWEERRGWRAGAWQGNGEKVGFGRRCEAYARRGWLMLKQEKRMTFLLHFIFFGGCY
ncbi:hypothetical protein MLD38_029384 [Melastoma candidum]|uniref:Uncharacterized protein n=1 Tax=Melastoma candidum TaxID=119954 RepID=A0ACB9N675_9MYRT|nr:hypothetical protein MLD38_029384 [Melastoma candidum]